MRLRYPPGFDAVGEDARGQVQKAFTRGQCQLNLTITRGATPPRVRLNEEVLSALLDAVGRLKLPPGVEPASVDGLLAVRGVVEIEDEGDAAASAELADALKAGVARAVAALAEARRAEGRALSGILAGQLDGDGKARRCDRNCAGAPGRGRPGKARGADRGAPRRRAGARSRPAPPGGRASSRPRPTCARSSTG